MATVLNAFKDLFDKVKSLISKHDSDMNSHVNGWNHMLVSYGSTCPGVRTKCTHALNDDVNFDVGEMYFTDKNDNYVLCADVNYAGGVSPKYICGDIYIAHPTDLTKDPEILLQIVRNPSTTYVSMYNHQIKNVATPTDTGDATTKQYVDNMISSYIPKGAIMWFYLSAAPSGWAICDGTNGTPNLIGRYPLGAKSSIGTAVEAGLPLASLEFTGTTSTASFTGATGWFDGAMWKHSGGCGGCFTDQGQGYGGAGGDGNVSGHRLSFSLSGSASLTPSGYVTMVTSGVYGKSSTVTPPSIKLLPCMKL